ncbi:hypothetical protein CHUAL_009837 [Chamberlinius hualienensis]
METECAIENIPQEIEYVSCETDDGCKDQYVVLIVDQPTDDHQTTARLPDLPLQTFCVDKVNKVYRIQEEPVTTREASHILSAHREGKLEPCLLETGPIDPKGGHIYIYQLKHPGDMDYLCDPYHFKQYGCRVGNFNIKKTYYILRTSKRNPNCTEKLDDCRVFHKVTYRFDEPATEKTAIIIQYYGDEKLAPRRQTPYCHATAHCKQLMKDQWKKLGESIEKKKTKPRKKKRKYGIVQKPGANDSEQSAVNIRNGSESVDEDEPTQWKTVEKPLASSADILDTLQLQHSQLSKFIKHFSFTPTYKYLICMEERVARFAQHLLHLSNENLLEPQLLTYHTTYKFGNYHISMLTMRNIKVEGEPLFPISFFISDVDIEEVHQVFWRVIVEELNLGQCCEKLPICASRRADVKNAILKNYPSCNLELCQLQLLKEIRLWLRENSKNKSSMVNYQNNLKDLMSSMTHDEFVSKINSFQNVWTKEFRSFIEVNYFDDLMKASLFNRVNGVAFRMKAAANNLSELTDRDELKLYAQSRVAPLDYCVLALYEIQMSIFNQFYQIEIEGNLKVPFQRHIFIQFGEYAENPSVPTDRLLLVALAKLAIREGLVNLDPVSHSFNVKNVEALGGSNSVIVTPKGQDTCTCGNEKPCYHIIAAYLALGWQIPAI